MGRELRSTFARTEQHITRFQELGVRGLRAGVELTFTTGGLALPGDRQAQREAVELRYWQGWTLAEIAAHQKRTVASVAGLVHRGLAKLRELMESD